METNDSHALWIRFYLLRHFIYLRLYRGVLLLKAKTKTTSKLVVSSDPRGILSNIITSFAQLLVHQSYFVFHVFYANGTPLKDFQVNYE